jgi:hypothetical protein
LEVKGKTASSIGLLGLSADKGKYFRTNSQAFLPPFTNNELSPPPLTVEPRLSLTSEVSQIGPHTSLLEREKTPELYHTSWLDRLVF